MLDGKWWDFGGLIYIIIFCSLVTVMGFSILEVNYKISLYLYREYYYSIRIHVTLILIIKRQITGRMYILLKKK